MGLQRWEIPSEPIPETSIQAQMKAGVRLVDGGVLDFSQGRETRQDEGIPDTLVCVPPWHIAVWVEVKRPLVIGPGVREGTTRILQEQGKWSWPQEEIHALLRASSHLVITIDEPDQILAYLAFLGHPVPPDYYRHSWDPTCLTRGAESRFWDPLALQRWEAKKAAQREARRKSGPKVQRPPSYRWKRR